MREWLKDWIEASLADDGIRDDSEFYDYIGHMRVISGALANIQLAFKDSPSFIKNSIDNALELAENLQEIRLEYFNFLVDTNGVVEIDATINGKDHLDDIYQLDEKAMQLAIEAEKLINGNGTLKAASDISQINTLLQRLKGIDSFLLSRTKKKVFDLTDDIENEANTTPKTPDKPEFDLTNYQSYSRPSMGVPTRPYQIYPQPSIPQSNITYSDNDSLFPKDSSSYVQGYQSQGNYSTPNQNSFEYVPKHAMKRSGTNKIPIRKLAELMKKARENGTVKKCATALTLLTVASVLGISALKNISPDEPTITTTPTFPPIISEEISKEVAPTATPEVIPTVTPTTTPSSISTPAPQKYKEGTLAYALQFMDDEFVHVVAESLRNSMKGRNEDQIRRYGYGVTYNRFTTDREYLEYVFPIIDSGADNLKLPNCDRFAIAPQMEQLSGDVAKYFITKALNESGKYNRTDYTVDDINFYWNIYGGNTKAFDVRTVKVKNNRLVVDQIVGTQDHFSGEFKKLISAHCALESAVEGTGPAKTDQLTKLDTHCAFGTQEGTVIRENTLQCYEILVNIFEKEPTLTVNSPGKGMKLVYENDYER